MEQNIYLCKTWVGVSYVSVYASLVCLRIRLRFHQRVEVKERRSVMLQILAKTRSEEGNAPGDQSHG